MSLLSSVFILFYTQSAILRLNFGDLGFTMIIRFLLSLIIVFENIVILLSVTNVKGKGKSWEKLGQICRKI